MPAFRLRGMDAKLDPPPSALTSLIGRICNGCRRTDSSLLYVVEKKNIRRRGRERLEFGSCDRDEAGRKSRNSGSSPVSTVSRV